MNELSITESHENGIKQVWKSFKFCSSNFFSVKDSLRTLLQNVFKEQAHLNSQALKHRSKRLNLNKIKWWEIGQTAIFNPHSTK
jgi:hypothetical protein